MTAKELIRIVMIDDPLYRKREYKGKIPQTVIADIGQLNYVCNHCNSIQTFALDKINEEHPSKYHQHLMQAYAILPGVSQRQSVIYTSESNYYLKFRCLMCNVYRISFFINFTFVKNNPNDEDDDDDKVVTRVTKVGQYPQLEAAIDSEIKKYLDRRDLELYQKALRCEAFSYGIGAYAYYRRIIENNVNELLKQISDATDNQELIDAIKEANKKRNAKDRLELIKDHAPSSFTANGQNVFTILYGVLSEGLHGRSDDDCLEAANSARICLQFLIKKISDAKETDKLLNNAVKDLTTKKGSSPIA